MIDPACIERKSESKVKCCEGNRFAVILNEGDDVLTKIKVDGCAITDGPRADWVVERNGKVLVIELKGRDIGHGANQVFATAKHWIEVERRCDTIAGLIVARQYPKASTSIQLKQQKFAKTYKGPLHVVTHNPELHLSHALSFKGPFRQ